NNFPAPFPAAFARVLLLHFRPFPSVPNGAAVRESAPFPARQYTPFPSAEPANPHSCAFPPAPFAPVLAGYFPSALVHFPACATCARSKPKPHTFHSPAQSSFPP